MATGLSDRLQGAPVGPAAQPASPERWLDALAVHARKAAPEAANACLAHAPGAVSLLDLGGGHGEYVSARVGTWPSTNVSVPASPRAGAW